MYFRTLCKLVRHDVFVQKPHPVHIVDMIRLPEYVRLPGFLFLGLDPKYPTTCLNEEMFESKENFFLYFLVRWIYQFKFFSNKTSCVGCGMSAPRASFFGIGLSLEMHEGGLRGRSGPNSNLTVSAQAFKRMPFSILLRYCECFMEEHLIEEVQTPHRRGDTPPSLWRVLENGE